MAQIGNLNTSLTLESSSFIVGLRRAAEQTQTSVANIEGTFNKLKTAAKATAAALALDAAFDAAGRALDYASSLGEVAQQLGVTTKDLQVYRFAATQVGVEQEEMDKGLQKLTRSLGEAREGAKKPAAAFTELGKIIGRDIVAESRTAGDAIPLIADALSKIEDPARRARLEVALFGKTGQQLDTLLSGGRGQIDELRNAAERLGLVLSDQLIQQADEAADKLALVKQILEAQLTSAVASNAELITDLGNAFIFLAGKAQDAVRIMKQALNLGAENKLFDVNQRLQQNQKDRASGRTRSSFLGFDITRPASAADLVRSDAEFRQLVQERNELLNVQRRANAPPPPAPRGSFGGVGSGDSRPKRTGKGRSSSPADDPFGRLQQSVIDTMRDVGENLARNWDEVRERATKQFYDSGGVDPSGDFNSIVADADKRRNARLDEIEEQREKMRQVEDERRALMEDTTRSVSTLYQDLFRSGTKGLWQDFKSIGLQAIAELAARWTIAMVTGQKFNFGEATSTIFKGLGFGGFFADGGVPPVGKASIVGERGPEIFVPKVSGTIIPNHALGGSTYAPHFDLRGALVDKDVYADMHRIAATYSRAAMVAAPVEARRQAVQAASRRLGR